MNDVTIIDADPRHLDALVEFNTAMALETEHKVLDGLVLRAGIARLLGDAMLGRYIIAERRSESVGAAGLTEIAGALMLTTEWSDWRNGMFWWIQSVYVRPAFRRTGVYRALHEHVRRRARAEPHVCGIRLYVERENIVAQRTYLAMGMTETVYRLYEELLPDVA